MDLVWPQDNVICFYFSCSLLRLRSVSDGLESQFFETSSLNLLKHSFLQEVNPSPIVKDAIINTGLIMWFFMWFFILLFMLFKICSAFELGRDLPIF